jgi:SOS-response transcriptional repressor LexA
MNQPLTKKQYETLEYLKQYHAEFGYMPSRKEISAKFGIAGGGAVFARIDRLRQKGYVEVVGGPRGYRLIKQIND